MDSTKLKNRIGDANRRLGILPELRRSMVAAIKDTLLYSVPASSQDQDLLWPEQAAQSYEARIYTVATNEVDYIWTISGKMVEVITLSRNQMSLSQNRWQMRVYWLSRMCSLVIDRTQELRQYMSQRNIPSTAIRSGLPSSGVTNLNPAEIRHAIEQSLNIHNMVPDVQRQMQEHPSSQNAMYLSEQQQLLLTQSDNSGMRNNRQNVPIQKTQQNASNLVTMQSQQPQQPPSSGATAGAQDADDEDWREEVYRRIKKLKQFNFSELMRMHDVITAELQEDDSHPRRQPDAEKLQALKELKHALTFLQVSEDGITTDHKDKLEKVTVDILNLRKAKWPRKLDPSTQPGVIKVNQLRPGTSGVTLTVKVVNTKIVQKFRRGGPDQTYESLVGDETGMIVFTPRNEEAHLMKDGNTLVLHNAKVYIFRRSMRLTVDGCGHIAVAEPATFSVDVSNNLSLIEFIAVTLVED